MTENDAAVLKAANLSPQAAEWSRAFDYMIIIYPGVTPKNACFSMSSRGSLPPFALASHLAQPLLRRSNSKAAHEALKITAQCVADRGESDFIRPAS